MFASPPQGAGNSISINSSINSGDAEVYLLRPSTETVNVALFARKKNASAGISPAAAPAAKAAATGGKKASGAATACGGVPRAGAGVAVWEGALEAWLREVGLASDPLSLADLLPSLQPA